MEIGAVDGEFMSQTLTLERNLSWSGLLVEPDPRSFAILQNRRRNASLSPLCVHEHPSDLVSRTFRTALAEVVEFDDYIYSRYAFLTLWSSVPLKLQFSTTRAMYIFCVFAAPVLDDGLDQGFATGIPSAHDGQKQNVIGDHQGGKNMKMKYL